MVDKKTLTPNTVLRLLKEGNRRFAHSSMTTKNHSGPIQRTLDVQHPIAVILSCSDSRIPVEYVFDKGIGDLFVTRVAGNIVSREIVASMEYACRSLGAKLVVVMGHHNCGAIKAAIDHVTFGNMITLTKPIEPSIRLAHNYQGEQSSDNEAYVEYVSRVNIYHSIKYIRQNSKILRDLEHNGTIAIVGAMYHMDTGFVEFFSHGA